MHARMPVTVLGAFIAIICAQPARATATLACEIADKGVTFDAHAVVSHGVGEVITQLKAEGGVALKGVPEHLRRLDFDSAHLTQSWLYRRDLRLRFYHEPGERMPLGSLELVIQARRASDREEDAFRGTYELTVRSGPDNDSPEGKPLKARGKVTCTVG